MKKILLTIGSLASVAAPAAAVVACGSNDTTEAQIIKFNASTVSLITSTRAATGDIAIEDMKEVIANTSDDDLASEVAKTKGKSKLSLIVEFKDAQLKVDAQVKINGANKPVVTVNKVYVNPKSGTFTLNEKRPKISAFKKYVNTLLTTMVEVGQKSGLTAAQIREEVNSKYGVNVGLQTLFFPSGEDATVPWSGAWVQNVAYARTAIVAPKDSNALVNLMNYKAGALTISTISTHLDAIETALRTKIITMKADATYGAFATEEEKLQGQSSPQSQVTVGTFTSKGATQDDMVVFAINGLPKDKVISLIKTIAIDLSSDLAANYIWNTLKMMI